MSRVTRIEVKGLSKRYGRQRALAAVDLDLGVGRVCAVLGHNGAGKSTLLGILSTLVRPTGGEVIYHAGTDTVASGPELRRHIGVLADASLVYAHLSALENLRFYAGLYGIADAEPKIVELLDRLGLDKEAQTRPAGGYSRGMVQKLALARALLHDPSILLLDEPFTGLDAEGVSALCAAIRRAQKEGRLVLCVTHDLATLADLADQVVVLAQGKVAYEARDTPFGQNELKTIYQDHAA